MSYHVSRGLREIVAPRQKMSKKQWQAVRDEYGGLCVFCGSEGTKENRGIVADHLISVTRFGELVLGNTVPACQKCNDTRGHKEWRPFIRKNFPKSAKLRIAAIEKHLSKHPYHPPAPKDTLNRDQQKSYERLFTDWRKLYFRACALRELVAKRRAKAQKSKGRAPV